MEQHNISNSSFSTPVSADYLIASGVMAVCFILGVPANIVVMIRLVGWLKGGSLTPRLMLSLAISDLLTLISLPVWIWSFLHGWVFGVALCKIVSYMLYLSLYCSMLCVTLMCVQRYLQVLHHEKWNKLGRNGKKILLSGMWILSGVLSCYAFIRCTPSLDMEGRLQCKILYRDDNEKVAILIWEIIFFMASFATLTYFYFHLYKGVTNSAFLRSNSLTKLVIRIVACFFIFWVPYQISNILTVTAVLLQNDSLLKSAESGDNIAAGLIFINSCVNPFLYAFSARALQQNRDSSENT